MATVMAFDIGSVFGAAVNFVLFGDPSKVHHMSLLPALGFGPVRFSTARIVWQ